MFTQKSSCERKECVSHPTAFLEQRYMVQMRGLGVVLKWKCKNYLATQTWLHPIFFLNQDNLNRFVTFPFMLVAPTPFLFRESDHLHTLVIGSDTLTIVSFCLINNPFINSGFINITSPELYIECTAKHFVVKELFVVVVSSTLLITQPLTEQLVVVASCSWSSKNKKSSLSPPPHSC